MIDSRDFAKYIIYMAGDKASDINMTKLQKYLYICDGLLLSRGYNAVNERAHAWNYGPVYPKVYKWYRNKVGQSVALNEIPADAVKEIQDNNYDSVIKQVLECFKDWSTGQLSAWTHQPNSPWSVAVEKAGGEMNGIISKEDMTMYFAGVLNGR